MSLTPVRLDRGAFVVSIDTEMAWGAAHVRDGSGPRHPYEPERDLVARLLEVFERHGVPATWAIVAHLFLDHCERGADGRPHPELLRPAYPWLDEDWFAIDPCSTLEDEPFYYGRDMVEQIQACPVPQEIGCHGFSHVMIGDEGSSPEVFDSELAASARAAEGIGETPKSFVYPRNSLAYMDRLAAHGYTSYRGPRAVPTFAGRPSWQRSILGRIDKLHPLAGTAVLPSRHESGIWNVPQTYMMAPATQRPRVPVEVWVRRPIARLRQAARCRSVFHLWFHPYNITAAPERSIEALDRICARAARLRDAGRIDILSMEQLADQMARSADAEADVAVTPG
jgi:peptidoglycan/xylan/chitin deacetylase (PgdA/CDA1 family)